MPIRVLVILALAVAGALFHAGPAQAARMFWEVDQLAASPGERIVLKDHLGVALGAVERRHVLRLQEARRRYEALSGIKLAKFTVIDDQTLNAFAAIGKEGPFISVHTGLLRVIGDDEDALAAVLGHEFAHLGRGHHAARKQFTTVAGLIGMVAGVAIQTATLGVVPVGGLGFELGRLGDETAVQSFSRDNEREADDVGTRWMAEAGYDPKGALRIQRLFARLDQGGGALDFLRSHPRSDERVANMERLVASLKHSPAPTQIAAAKVAESEVVAIQVPDTALARGMAAYNRGEWPLALAEFRAASAEGDPQAMGYLGAMINQGLGTTPDFTEARGWIEKSSEAGYARSTGLLGQMWMDGRGGPKDRAKGLALLAAAAEAGDTRATGILAMINLTTPTGDPAQGRAWAAKAAEAGNSNGHLALAIAYQSGRGGALDLAQAVQHFRTAADLGNVFAMSALGQIYENGVGEQIPRDPKQAFDWYKKAADVVLARPGLDHRAMAPVDNLARMYLRGMGVRRDCMEFTRLNGIAADRHYDGAAVTLALAYLNGACVHQDPDKARDIVEKATAEGNLLAPLLLADIHLRGRVKAPLTAVEVLKAAALKGSPRAPQRLAEIYWQGEGVRYDPVEARAWLELCLERSPQLSKLADDIQGGLTSEDLAEALARAKGYREAMQVQL